MKKYSVFISIVAIILLGAVVYLVLKNSPAQTEEKKAETTEKTVTEAKTEALVDKSLSTTKTYNEPTKYATFNISYPQFKDASVAFNKKIEGMVMESIKAHTEDSENNWKARWETRTKGENITEFPKASDKFQFQMKWSAAQINKNFISTLLDFGGYSGGAHGYQNMASFNYDVKNKKEVVLADLFPNDPNYLKTISAFTREDLIQQIKKQNKVETKFDEATFKEAALPQIESGTAPDEMNFSIFTFTPDSIKFYFTEYQVAPYAAGQFSVTMPRK